MIRASRILAGVGFLVASVGAGHLHAQTTDSPGGDLVSDKPLYRFTESEIDAYIRRLRSEEQDVRKRVIHLARKAIGQPYEIYLLGEYPFETHDPDPLYRLDRSDCVTFCEHMFSMALAEDWWSFLANLQRIRYRDGRVGMLTRNHYTVYDWDRNNAFLFEDQTPLLGDGEAAVPLNQVLRKSRFFKKFGLGEDITDFSVTDTYIPRENVPAILDELRDADFVNIIRGDKNAQWAGHTGLIAIGPKGEVNFLHSARPTVREQPLLDYLASDRRCVGIKILRLRPGAEGILKEVIASSSAATVITEQSLNQALAKRRAEAPPAVRPIKTDWLGAARLQAFRIDEATPVDDALQTALEQLDQKVAANLKIPADKRAFGVLDLTDLRLAMIQPDAVFYAASVPKIAILLAYFETHPEAVDNLPDDVAHELGMMIKRSDNELAAKYGRIVGREKVQEILESKPYQLYESTRGGLWYGKHYGPDEKRVGDPVHDHSHAATVRQCLRFYLMMEQGRLVNYAASRRMRAIFASPHLELADSKFVAGLQGRDLSIIRKSGTWKNWHLDTARVEHGDRVYLLAGMVHHENGDQYLAKLAAGVDELLCGDSAPRGHVHKLFSHASGEDFEGGVVQSGHIQPGGVLLKTSIPTAPSKPGGTASYESPVINSDVLFNEALVSANVDAPPHAGYRLEIRVGRRIDQSWSPYLTICHWGDTSDLPGGATEFDGGRIKVDYFESNQRFDRLQYRLTAVGNPSPRGVLGADTVSLRIARIAICVSDTTGRLTSVPTDAYELTAPRGEWNRRLSVPYRSQRVQRRDLAPRICSPTSVAMVLAYRGIDRPTQEVALRGYDSVHDIYGNWPRMIQTAYSYGAPGYLMRFRKWGEVERMIARDQPIIISVTVEDGELPAAPYDSTGGHLLVITGFDDQGGVWVNDPAASDSEKGRRIYSREGLQKVWLDRKRGTAYLIEAPRVQPMIGPPADAAGELLVDVQNVDPRIIPDIRYATKENFTHEQLYEKPRCLLRESVARRLKRVQDRLATQGLGLKIYDGYRPLSVQKKMWKLVPDPRYVADPAKGSRHNRGAAVDVTLVDSAGRELEMPTGYDDFTEAAHRDYDGGTEASRQNRDLLAGVMQEAGFTGLSTEWWHFDAPGWRDYPILDKAIGSISD